MTQIGAHFEVMVISIIQHFLICAHMLDFFWTNSTNWTVKLYFVSKKIMINLMHDVKLTDKDLICLVIEYLNEEFFSLKVQSTQDSIFILFLEKVF